LTKSLGFALGVDFKEKALELTEKNVHKIKQGMVFALSLGLHDVPLTPQVSTAASVAVVLAVLLLLVAVCPSLL
jgi:nucleosome binding factor SPN SPT16 subunit